MKRFLAIAMLATSFAALAQTQPQNSQDFEAAGRLQRVLALKDPMIAGEIPTYYSPGSEQHARDLQRFMTGERVFAKRELRVDVPLSLAVLDPAQWQRVETQIPFPMPSVDGRPSVALLPADWAAAPGFFPKQSDIDPAVVKAVEARGVSWDEATHRAMDLTGGHELGHTVEHVYGIDPGTNWLNEFLANYVMVAYLQRDRRDLLWLIPVLQSLCHLDQPEPYVSLDDFESRYTQILDTDASNYAWYQGQFTEQVLRVYARQGVDFLRKVREAFPAGDVRPEPDNAETLRCLEKISPGFIAWARAMDAKPKLTAHH